MPPRISNKLGGKKTLLVCGSCHDKDRSDRQATLHLLLLQGLGFRGPGVWGRTMGTWLSGKACSSHMIGCAECNPGMAACRVRPSGQAKAVQQMCPENPLRLLARSAHVRYGSCAPSVLL